LLGAPLAGGAESRDARSTDIKNTAVVPLTVLRVISVILVLQEAQLSQRGRATLCVIEYFAKSLKVIEMTVA